MSSMRLNSVTIRAAALAAVGVTTLTGLSACEERPYSVPVRSASYVPPRSQDLAGAPVEAPPAYAEAAPAYAATPPAPTDIPPEQAYAQASPSYAPPPVQTYRPAPSYDTGPPMIVAMAPIPNPPDRYGRAERHRDAYAVEPSARRGYTASMPPRYAPPAPEPRQYGSAPYGSYGSGAVVGLAPVPNPTDYSTRRHAHAHKRITPTPAHTASPRVSAYAAKPLAAPKLMRAPASRAHTYAAVTPSKASPAKGAATPVAKKGVAPQTAATTTGKLAATKTKTAKAGAATSGGDRTAKLAALQASLTEAIAKTAVLTAPARFTANQPADVSLTLPAAFAETLRTQADKQGLSDAAASVNITSVLAGDGFSVTPDDTQSQPLTVGQPTQFHWTVKAQPGAKGPLHVDVGADMLGAGSDTLGLGTVQKNAGTQMKLTPNLIVAGFLALIAILVLGWLARSGNTPSRSASARGAARRARTDGYARPIDRSDDTRV